MLKSFAAEASVRPSGDQAMLLTRSRCSVSVARGSQVSVSQRRIVLSADPDASNLHFEFQATLPASAEWPCNVAISFPSRVQIRMLESSDADAILSPSGDHASLTIRCRWPLNL